MLILFRWLFKLYSYPDELLLVMFWTKLLKAVTFSWKMIVVLGSRT